VFQSLLGFQINFNSYGFPHSLHTSGGFNPY